MCISILLSTETVSLVRVKWKLWKAIRGLAFGGGGDYVICSVPNVVPWTGKPLGLFGPDDRGIPTESCCELGKFVHIM